MIFIKLLYCLNNALLAFFRFILFKKLNKKNVERILIFRNGSLGDSICALPAIEATHNAYPKAKIDLLTHSGGFPELSIANIIDPLLVNNIINYEGIELRQLIQLLKSNKYDLFILLPQVHSPFKKFIKDLLFAKAIKVKYAVGFKRCVIPVFQKTQSKQSKISNVRDFLLSIAVEAGAQMPDRLSYKLNIKPEDENFIEALFIEKNLNIQSKIAAVTIGAKRPQNRWPIQYFEVVIDYLQNLGYSIIIIGGKDDKLLVDKLDNKNKVVDLTGKLTVMQSAIILKRCSMFITNDTGPMHLAYAVGTYTFAIFSSRDFPNLWFPPVELSQVFRNNTIQCSECFSNTCKNNICMQAIKPEQVIKAISNYLYSSTKISHQ